jgi:hypothetical protein
MKKNLAWGELVQHMREMRNSCKVLVGNPKERRYVGVNGSIIFKNCLDQGPVVASCFVRDKKHLNWVVLVCMSAAEGL